MQNEQLVKDAHPSRCDELIDALPDLLLLLRRDGVILNRGGGRGLEDLALPEEATGLRLHELWPQARCELVMGLLRRAIALRASTEAKFADGARHYGVRLHARGPDRALCMIRALPAEALGDALDVTGERLRPQFDRREFLRRLQDARAPTTRLDIARELGAAIENGDIRLRYVGRHDLATGRLVSWVGYLRWMHPVRGEVRPIEFLRVAETTGLATALSRTTLRCLQEDFAALSSEWDADVRISFGALRHHVLQADFGADIAAFLDSGAVPAQRLELRIAEQTFVECNPGALEDLRRLGVRLVVDEAGRGLASLDRLARAPLWGLQLDRAWVTASRRDEVALKVCRAGISLAGALGLVPLAAGIDDEEQRRQFLAFGCRYGSGDIFENAIPTMMKAYRTALAD